jgi:hypothetical protein
MSMSSMYVPEKSGCGLGVWDPSTCIASLPSEAVQPLTSILTMSLAMDPTAHRNVGTIEHVIETTGKALKEYEIASQRLDLVANALLRPVWQSLDRIKDRLESVVDDEEVIEKLNEITVGIDAAPLLDQLDWDLFALCTYLRNANSPLREAEVNGCAQVLGRYAGVLKVVLSKSMK